MILNHKIDSWLKGVLWYKEDTTETLEQKVYLVGNMIIPAILICLDLLLLLLLGKIQLFLIVTTLVLIMVITTTSLIIVKRGIKWFLYLYYGGYIILCCIITLIFGGLPNSCGVWGGAFICFILALGIENKKLSVLNAMIYSLCLIVIGFSYPYLTPVKQWNPSINNLFLTINEVWMCLYLVKAFYDSIVKKTEEAKIKAIELQELDLLKSRLYANIAHEFRTPLTLIRGNAEEIGEEHRGLIHDQATSIVRNSEKILFLVNQMLNLSRIEEGGVSLHYVQSDLIPFVRFIVGSFQGFAESRKIRLHYQPLCAQLMMDIEKEKLEESLSNLMSNAIKYTPEGGDVYISVHLSDPAISSEQQVEISVRDTGIGIPAEQLDKIFIRFYRVEDPRFTYQEGSGIGLTLVNEYLKLMKGSIRVSSQPGEGSEFVIVLPVTQNAEIEQEDPAKDLIKKGKEISLSTTESNDCIPKNPHLLIIEDNKEMISHLSSLLANEYQLLTAENGIQGIELAIKHIPDIILCDVMMPGKDGFQVCKHLKNDFRTNHIPIVLLTARADTGSRISGLEQGADAYLTKPFNKKELMICLKNQFIQRETLRLKYSSNLFDQKAVEKEAGLNEKFLARVITFLERNYRNYRYGICNLYSDMKISRVQLHRKLTALTGLSASNFIRNFRLQKARQLLLESAKNVTDIAYEVGFSDANYFSKAFLQEYGLTATELRKSFV